jgi:8-oxo-dGTP pyrophosphatase MutT (NUDIX family)
MLLHVHEAMIAIDVDTVRAAFTRASARDEAEAGGVAAVAAVLRQGATGAELLLIERAKRDGDPWSGHMALPGGRRDPEDASLLETALRETREEVGLDLAAEADLVGRLTDVDIVPRGDVSRGWIRPFVFALRQPEGRADVVLTPSPAEVEAVLWAPLQAIRGGAHDTTIDWKRDSVAMTFPGWNVEGRIVWGLTYRMMSSLFELL